jgi:hypothetical protein
VRAADLNPALVQTRELIAKLSENIFPQQTAKCTSDIASSMKVVVDITKVLTKSTKLSIDESKKTEREETSG